MIDIESAVYTAVATKLRQEFPGIFVTGEESETPPRFPCASFVEDDNSSYTASNDFQKADHHVNVMYTANAYSDLGDGKKAQARKIINAIDEVMLKLGFVRILNSPTPNLNRTIARRTARWRGVVSEEYRIYQS